MQKATEVKRKGLKKFLYIRIRAYTSTPTGILTNGRFWIPSLQCIWIVGERKALFWVKRQHWGQPHRVAQTLVTSLSREAAWTCIKRSEHGQHFLCSLTSSEQTKRVKSACPHPSSRPPGLLWAPKRTAREPKRQEHWLCGQALFLVLCRELRNPPTSPMKLVLLSHPFLKWGRRGLERWRICPRSHGWWERDELNLGRPATEPGTLTPPTGPLLASDSHHYVKPLPTDDWWFWLLKWWALEELRLFTSFRTLSIVISNIRGSFPAS